MTNKLHIGLLTGRIPYPNGMASAQRIHLMARAMAEAGAAVNVWVDGLDSWTDPRNPEATGERDGISFEYLLGKTQASRHKWRRIFDRFALIMAARLRMSETASAGILDGLYFYTSDLKFDFERAVVRSTAQKHKFPVVIDLREAPWCFNPNQSMIEKIVSPLCGADGVICISSFLADWVRQENTRTGRNVALLEIPILTDVNEFAHVTASPPGKTVLFAGSPAYDETLRFLLAAMETVWASHPDCNLVITGGATESTPGTMVKKGNTRIRYAGFLKRSALLQEYSASSVLAIPMFDDVRSNARFPTKLGEYLASGRPVVTNQVGEIARYLENDVNACVTPPGDAIAFAKSICRRLDDQAGSQVIGMNGRRVAQQHFHYANYGARLCEFFSSMKNGLAG
ncbi:MAG: glycosyltransferase family 4 protein [Victivallaceae bacterium]|jgi:glycosyltransferase involved in cell wall biosynthesis